ncbi:MAG TPA: long-chain fatty acid--CoA ligase [Candidatus Acidoferrales bacterium]|nr:long-chain fatty acid--CoA ligase [Candidatus Acidoferrales bacterium]
MAKEYPPLTKSFLDAVDQYPNPRMQIYRTANGWESYSSAEVLKRVASLARSLDELGIKPGDRVAIFAPNCPEWHVADFAILGLGATSVPIYFNESPDRMTYILNDSAARIVLAAGEAQARLLWDCRERLPQIEQVICSAPPQDLASEVLRFETLVSTSLEGDVAEYRKHAAEVTGVQLATIIYTSGTTGEPKGVMLSHANVSSNTTDAFDDYALTPADLGLSFLPLAHVYERVVDYGYIFRGIPVAYVDKIENVAQALLEVHPTMVAAVPRFYEKMFANIIQRGHHEKGLRRSVFDWAIRVAERAVPWRAYGKDAPFPLRMQWELANKLVYPKIREGLGGKIRIFSSGGAPLAPELAAFFWSIDVPVYQGYGLTETSPIISANVPGANKVGTVGRPIRNVQVRIAEDGEILVKGPNIMQGYYRRPDETRNLSTVDGWFCTGDIGRLDDDGYLSVTDRKKELLKTAAGKFVAPAPIENMLKTSTFISNAIIVGDRRKFVAALIVPNFVTIESEAGKAGQDCPAAAHLINHPYLRDLISREVERLTASLAQYEKPKRFALLEQDFSFANGELTYTLKMKRRVIEHRYQDVIARIYADVEEPKPQPRA